MLPLDCKGIIFQDGKIYIQVGKLTLAEEYSDVVKNDHGRDPCGI